MSDRPVKRATVKYRNSTNLNEWDDYFTQDEYDRLEAGENSALEFVAALPDETLVDPVEAASTGTGTGTTTPVVNSLSSTSTSSALAAAQGKALDEKVRTTLYIDDAAATTAGVTSGEFYPLKDGNQWFLLEGTLRRMP